MNAMKIPFTKMHGCGNDFVVVDCLERDWPDLGTIAKQLCHRRFGVGADQLLTIKPSDTADFKMEIYNADGGEVEMCGNGIRCFARYVHDHGLTKKTAIEVETLAGVVRPRLMGDQVKVDMGRPILEGQMIPVAATGRITDHPLRVGGEDYRVTCVSMGNPHCVLYVDDVDELRLEDIGPKFENHHFFPNRVNTEFVQVLEADEVRMRVWERGAGETWACGTGACAVTVAGVLAERTERKLALHLLGGTLKVEWASDDHVYMTGPAEEVFEGVARI
jgi:diaminopimelate epimerase